ncbi:MAG: hypothetical protein EHM20_15045 [Alphaproteobacteria bacterium]|nr:MAG: hypothetical protein EHM20_15045 [Alphaproteobacteria bacterium]
MRKGDKFEKDFSLHTHRVQVPVLISSQLLRSVNAGQIDVAGLVRKNKSWVLYLVELKSSIYPSAIQWLRLKRSQDYLSKVLDIETKLEVKFCQKADH